MEAVASIDYLSDVEPAPGRLALVQRFVNTVDHEHGREMLHSTARLRAVLVELGLIDRRTRVTEADLSPSRTTTSPSTWCSKRISSFGSTSSRACSARSDATSTALSPTSSGSSTERWPTAPGHA
jgi:hypothetical protein